ncbi:MAG: hypothetical protein RSE47_03340 [Acidaminococcaceae bacterium]
MSNWQRYSLVVWKNNRTLCYDNNYSKLAAAMLLITTSGMGAK